MSRAVSDLTDEQIVDRVQRGETSAFASIFERHYTRLRRFLRASGVPEPDVEDLVGETFCRALTRIDQFDLSRGKRYLTYLYSIARNLAIDRVRARSTAADVTQLDEQDEPADIGREDSIVEQIFRMEQVRLIRRAMERLSASDREILTLAYDRELTCIEIQSITGKPSISAVTTHVYRAMQKLRTHVGDLASTPGQAPWESRP